MYQIRRHHLAGRGDAGQDAAAATRRRETDEARPLGYLSVAVVASLLAHISSSTKVRRAGYRP